MRAGEDEEAEGVGTGKLGTAPAAVTAVFLLLMLAFPVWAGKLAACIVIAIVFYKAMKK